MEAPVSVHRIEDWLEHALQQVVSLPPGGDSPETIVGQSCESRGQVNAFSANLPRSSNDCLTIVARLSPPGGGEAICCSSCPRQSLEVHRACSTIRSHRFVGCREGRGPLEEDQAQESCARGGQGWRGASRAVADFVPVVVAIDHIHKQEGPACCCQS